MKTPTKKELLELQRRYRTDRKIGEALGGVPEYLIAYWRRKKGIAAYTSPKYDEKQIKELWGQYGDDRAAGEILGISANGYRYWRKKYGITEKPQRLKLAQLQLPIPGLSGTIGRRSRKTFLHKIIERKRVIEGEVGGHNRRVRPDRIFISNGNILIDELLKSDGVINIKKPGNVYISMRGPFSRNGYREGLKILREYGNISSPNIGGHIFSAMGRGNILPGELVVSNDPAVLGVGAVGAFGAFADNSIIAETLSMGMLEIPEFSISKITILDTPKANVKPLDIMLHLKFRTESGNFAGRAIEYSGDTIERMNLDNRFSLCYLSRFLECYATAIYCDRKIERDLRKKALMKFRPIKSDPGYNYDFSIRQTVLEINPLVGLLKDGEITVLPLKNLKGKRIDTVIAGYYSGGLFSDIAEMVSIIGRRKISPMLEAYIRPATNDILLMMEDKGMARKLLGAGFSILPPSPFLTDLGFPGPLSELGNVLVTDPSALPIFPKDYPYAVYLTNSVIAANSALAGSLTDRKDK